MTFDDVIGSLLECILSRMLYIRTRSVSFQPNPPEVTLTEDATPKFQRQPFHIARQTIIILYAM